MDLILETERLLIREMLHEDADALFDMDKNPDVHKYLWQKPFTKIEEIHDYITYIRKQYQDNGIGRFSTILKETNELIGWTGIKYINDHVENGKTNFYDYGYRLNVKSWNKGYATEASKAWLEYAFNQMNIPEMNAYTHAENGASNHVLQKVGFNFVENYQDENDVTWKWWQIKKQQA
ncbi:GNAT family N-acetyltransferase [Flavobacterium antarcticum]|uniref:GNAT family N-acetyltransferase n=1 Tax=Flavobacterium antarcticum TaxID=271155 RepID=UPI0003B43AA3|nr:GNAT family N-acetyltransferase [Flavobacterium antarcticum]